VAYYEVEVKATDVILQMQANVPALVPQKVLRHACEAFGVVVQAQKVLAPEIQRSRSQAEMDGGTMQIGAFKVSVVSYLNQTTSQQPP
jgi:hypothetical protein